MGAFILIMFAMFLFFLKSYSKAQKKDMAESTDKHRVFVFTVFIFICSMIWLVFTYATKLTAYVLFSYVLYRLAKDKAEQQKKETICT